MASRTEEQQTTKSDSRHITEMRVREGINFFSVDCDLLGERVEPSGYFPDQLFKRFIDEAMKLVEPARLANGEWFTAIPRFDGVWASSTDLAASLSELREVLIDWILLKISHRDRDIPLIAGINLNIIG